MSERLAGSSVLALGSSVSEIASNINAVLLDKKSDFELGLTGIIGAGLFELTVGLAIGCFLINKSYSMSYKLLSRDLIIYLLTLVLLYYFLECKYIDIAKVYF